MPNYKVVDSDKLDADLARIADVIRKKSGVTVKLDFPDAYINVLNGLLTRIPMSVSEGLSYTLSLDGTEYSVSGIGTCTDTDIVIPPIYEGKPVTGIRGRAFYSRFGLTSITIPDSVTSIGDVAFYDCTGLTSITMLSRNPPTIASNTFGSTTSLEKIFVPKGCGAAYKSATNWAAYADKIEEASIGLAYTLSADGTEYSVSGLGTCTDTYVVIPSTYNGKPVTSIGSEAFSEYSSLTGITIPGSVTSIGDSAFFDCDSLASITIPNSVMSIGIGAFYNCSGLTSITIGNGVTSIGNHAFGWCSGLTSITVNAQNTVYHSAGSCLIETKSKTLIAGYKSSVIPDDGSVTSIGDDAFSGCSSLTSITIPDSVTNIGDSAFFGCSALTSITIPDKVTSIGDWVFADCYNLTSITIPDSVTSIDDYAFCNCTSLTSITIPDSVTSIGDGAFYGCSGLTSITIPDSVTSIGDVAFYDCTGLTSITMLSRNPPTIASNTFGSTTSLEKIFVPKGCGAAYKSATNWSAYADKIEEVIA